MIAKPEAVFSNLTQRPLAVVSTVTPWHEPPRIRHQLTRQLTRFYNVLYIQLPFGSDSREDHFEQIHERLVIYRPKKLHHVFARLWIHLKPFHSFFDKRLVRNIENTIQGTGYKKAILINFQFNFPEIMNSNLFIKKIYFCNDEFPGRAKLDWQKRQLKEYEDQVASNADACIAVSLPLLDKLKKISKNTRLLLPGHEFDTKKQRAGTIGLRKRERPVHVCFMGYINYRICFDWLLEMVKCNDFDLTLLGPVQQRNTIKELLNFHNFRTSVPLEGQELQNFLTKMDVLIMPYDTRLKSVQATTAPNKLFQYLACGKPIVISDMSHFIDLPDKCIYRARNAKEFVECVRRAYDEDCEEFMRRRIEIAEQNTWDARGNELVRLLQSLHEGSVPKPCSIDPN